MEHGIANELLISLEEDRFKVIAYADDIAIAASGNHPQILIELLQTAVNKLLKWADRCLLGVNPHKTELVLFTRKYKIPQLDPKSIKAVPLHFSDEAKYLGLIFDKLNWKPNIHEIVKKSHNSSLF